MHRYGAILHTVENRQKARNEGEVLTLPLKPLKDDKMILKLIGGNNPKLKTKVTLQDPAKALAIGKHMIGFAMKHSCLGLAAVQFGVMERVCIVNLDGTWRIFVDPKIETRSGSQISPEEGCLTWPKKRGDIKRPTHITVTHTEVKEIMDTRVLETFEGFQAIQMEHEIDHLDGIRCIDKFILT